MRTEAGYSMPRFASSVDNEHLGWQTHQTLYSEEIVYRHVCTISSEFPPIQRDLDAIQPIFPQVGPAQDAIHRCVVCSRDRCVPVDLTLIVRATHKARAPGSHQEVA